MECLGYIQIEALHDRNSWECHAELSEAKCDCAPPYWISQGGYRHSEINKY